MTGAPQPLAPKMEKAEALERVTGMVAHVKKNGGRVADQFPGGLSIIVEPSTVGGEPTIRANGQLCASIERAVEVLTR